MTIYLMLQNVKVPFSPKNADVLQKENAGISKIEKALLLKVYFLKLNMCVYLCTKFQVSSKILTSFPPPPLLLKMNP